MRLSNTGGKRLSAAPAERPADAKPALSRWNGGGALLALLITLVFLLPLRAQDKRAVQGTVTDQAGNVINGAIVQLENTKTLQVRSFITQEHGNYYFQGLDTDIDYRLKAEYEGDASPVKTLSQFDSRKQAVVNLKVERRKK